MTNPKIAKVMDELGLDELTAWRHVRDREILRQRFKYQDYGKFGARVKS